MRTAGDQGGTTKREVDPRELMLSENQQICQLPASICRGSPLVRRTQIRQLPASACRGYQSWIKFSSRSKRGSQRSLSHEKYMIPALPTMCVLGTNPQKRLSSLLSLLSPIIK